MLGLLGTLNLAAQSLQTQMTGVEVTGQNLANVNTTGYTRQTVNIQTTPDIETTSGPEGTGAEVVSIQQAVNTLLNNQIQGQQSTSGYWNGQQSTLQSVQDDLNEFLSNSGSASSSTSSTGTTTSSGLSTLLNTFFNDFQTVATSPTSVSARQQLISDAQNLASAFNQINSGLNKEDADLNSSISDDVTSANQLINGIAGLNQQIAAEQFGGGNANDLMDERQQDLNNLAQLVNITTSTGTNGAVDVSINGQAFVTGNQVMDTLQTYDPGNGNLLITSPATGATQPLTLTGGSIQGTIDARDNTLGSLQTSLNTLASSLITQVNSIYSAGYSLTGTTGANFFEGANASDISVNSTLADDPSAFQASGSATASGDNSVVLQLAELADASQSNLQNQTFSNSLDQTVGSFGDALQTANSQVSDQTTVMDMLKSQQSSVSGVSLDQEMTNLLGYQQAYEASAELVTTVNNMLSATMQMVSA
ncbi:MAG TPA: flagellar hook-associated protein FlgK [Candidatus Acidoferrales bacterium]|jgi:flagellar hook-associated protein 1 FlgK|nr:flagellar hook-associated protein FlgK [Candidatus Acidoferrales bacterium]